MSQWLEVEQYWGDLCLDVLHFAGRDVTIGPSDSEDFSAAEPATLFRYDRVSDTYSAVARRGWDVQTEGSPTEWEIDTGTFRFRARRVPSAARTPKSPVHPDVPFIVTGFVLAVSVALSALVSWHELSRFLAPPEIEITYGCFRPIVLAEVPADAPRFHPPKQGVPKGPHPLDEKDEEEPQVAKTQKRLDVDEVIKRHMNAIRYCHQRRLTKDPNPIVNFTIDFAIQPSGKATDIAVTTEQANTGDFEECVRRRVERMDFGRMDNAEVLAISYPFHVNPG